MNSNPQSTSKPAGLGQAAKSRRKLIVILSLATVLVVASVIYFAVSGDTDDMLGELFVVQKSPLTISISEAGTIKPINQIILANELEGMTRIIFLIPESTQVKKGDLLVELETSELETQKINQEIQVKNAEASQVQASENLAVTKSQAESDIAKAKLDREFASMDHKKFVEGEQPQEIEQAKANITMAEEEFKRAQDRLAGSRKLAKKKFISQSDLKADELSEKQKAINLSLAKGKLEVLEKYTHPRKLRELESNLEQTLKAIERTERKAKADIAQAKAQDAAKDAGLKKEQARLEKIKDQISKARILAPQDGMVVYATTVSRRWWSNEEPLAEGQQVRRRQELIHLPTSEGMKAEIKIHESALGKIRLGQPVTVQIDAFDKKEIFAATVTKISPMPDSRSRHMNPDLSVYVTEVQLEGDVTGLKTGMSCQVEILVAEYDDVMPVPVQCVMQVDGEPTVYVQDGDQARPRTVEVGLDNNRMVAVLSGLKEGEKILLNPPLAKAAVSNNKKHAVLSKAKEDSKTKAKTDTEKSKKPDKAKMDEMKKKFESMSPEQQKKFAERRSKRRDSRSKSSVPPK